MSTGQGAQRYVVSEHNPNPTESCVCYPGGHGEDSGGPFIIFTASEPLDAPHTVVCAACIHGCARALVDGEVLGAGEAPRPDYEPERDHPVPAPHENPVADTLEEAQRLIDEARAEEDIAI
jgi:hypothetical protein